MKNYQYKTEFTRLRVGLVLALNLIRFHLPFDLSVHKLQRAVGLSQALVPHLEFVVRQP